MRNRYMSDTWRTKPRPIALNKKIAQAEGILWLSLRPNPSNDQLREASDFVQPKVIRPTQSDS